MDTDLSENLLLILWLTLSLPEGKKILTTAVEFWLLDEKYIGKTFEAFVLK